MQNPDRFSNVLLVHHEETCQGVREVIIAHAVEAYSARDMRVRAVIYDHPHVACSSTDAKF